MFDTLEALKHILWPTRCAACDVLVADPKSLICDACRRSIRPPSAVEKPDSTDDVFVCFAYEAAVTHLISNWKFHEDYAAQRAIIQLINDRIPDMLNKIHAPACILPIPPHPKRLRERGFDPVWTLAKGMKNALKKNGLDVDFRDDILQRTRHTVRQASLTLDERKHNLDGAFQCINPLPNAQILLVDDVLTSGSTMNACAKILRNAGANDILAIALAHPDSKDEPSHGNKDEFAAQ